MLTLNAKNGLVKFSAIEMPNDEENEFTDRVRQYGCACVVVMVMVKEDVVFPHIPQYMRAYASVCVFVFVVGNGCFFRLHQKPVQILCLVRPPK